MADFHKNLRKSLRRDCEDIQLAKLLAAAEKSLISANLLSEVDAINRYTGTVHRLFTYKSFSRKLVLEAAVCKCSCKQVFLKILQYSHEDNCAGASIVIKHVVVLCNVIEKRLWETCFPVKFGKCLILPVLQNTQRRLPLYFSKNFLRFDLICFFFLGLAAHLFLKTPFNGYFSFHNFGSC